MGKWSTELNAVRDELILKVRTSKKFKRHSDLNVYKRRQGSNAVGLPALLFLSGRAREENFDSTTNNVIFSFLLAYREQQRSFEEADERAEESAMALQEILNETLDDRFLKSSDSGELLANGPEGIRIVDMNWDAQVDDNDDIYAEVLVEIEVPVLVDTTG